MADSTNPPNWYDVFPTPRSTAPLISRETVLSQLYSPDLLLIDVRRTDYEGGTIIGSLNIPAQSFYWNRETLYNLCKRAGIKRVAFYCGKLLFPD
jgi:arsenical-resistance protein 2